MSQPAPFTPELSKRARRELGLSQADVIKASGIQAYKLKQWEGRGLTIELADIRKLTDFYESQGVNLQELTEHVSRTSGHSQASADDKAPGTPDPLQAGFTYNPRPGFVINDQLTAEVVEALMERMEVNDERIAALTGEAFKAGLFADLSGDTEEKARELIGTLAENHVIFRALQGRSVISTSRDEPKTLGDYLGKMLATSPVYTLIAGDTEAADEVEA